MVVIEKSSPHCRLLVLIFCSVQHTEAFEIKVRDHNETFVYFILSHEHWTKIRHDLPILISSLLKLKKMYSFSPC
jgi:hypothetical protein